MSKIRFEVCGAGVEYELAEHGKHEELRINDELIVDLYGDVGAWGADYHRAIAGLSGAAKSAAEGKYLRQRAEALIISEIFSLREMIREAS
jgi:PII-like signaling protein